MTKLNGTSGHLFSGLAESLNVRQTSRSAKSGGGRPPGGASFNDLLHTVSNLAKQALKDEGSDTPAKTGAPGTRVAHPTETEKPKNAAGHELIAVSAGSEPAEEPSDEKAVRSSEKQRPVDHPAGADVRDLSDVAGEIGQEIAAAPAVMPQMQSRSADKDLHEEEAFATTKRAVQGTARAATVDPNRSSEAPAAARSHAPVSQTTTAPQPLPWQGSEPSRATPGVPGFDAVSANVERAAKAAGRDALPDTTKVTVVQQETHLPPAQFNAPQQVANAVVSGLKGTPAPSALTAADPAASQTNAPDQPLKILTVNLEPPALGNVTVRLRLVGTEVSVQLAAERKDTSQMLEQQRDQIRDLMQSAGYVADVAPVQHGSMDGLQSGSGQSQPQLAGQQQSSPQSQGNFGGAGTSSGQSERDGKQARQEGEFNQETRHDQDVAPHHRRGPVYL